MAVGARDLALFDLALDYGNCARIAMSRADTCSDSVFDAAVGTIQAAGIAVSLLGDVAGLIVMRTVAMLANEAADAVTQKIASARDVDLAMQKGVNYPLGPLAWAERIGVARVRDVLAHLGASCGGERYRVSPLIARSAAAGRALV